MPWRRPGHARALGREIGACGQVAGGQELLKRAVRKRELSFALALAQAEQQARALLDEIDHQVSLVLALEQPAEGVDQAALADLGGAVMADIFFVHREGEFLQHLAQIGKLEPGNGQRIEQRLVCADLPVPPLQQQVHRFVVQVGAVIGQPAAVAVQRGHQREQQRVARKRQQVRPLVGAQQVFALASGIAGRAPLALDQRGVPGADELLDLVIGQFGQCVHATRGVGAAGPGVGPRGQYEAALGPGVFHQITHRAQHALAPGAVTALVQPVEQEQSTVLACDALHVLHGVGRHAVAAGIQVACNKGPQIAGTRGLIARRQSLGEAAQHDPDRQQGAVPPGGTERRQFVAMPLPRLCHREQHAGAQRALAAAGLAQHRQLTMLGQRFERRDWPRLALRGRVVTLLNTLAGKPLRQHRVLGNLKAGVQRHIDVGKLQRRLPRLVGRCVDLTQPQPGQIGGECVQVQRNDGLGLFGVFAHLGDLFHHLDEIAPDVMAAAGLYTSLNDGAALGGNRSGLRGSGQLRLKLSHLALQRFDVVRVVGIGIHTRPLSPTSACPAQISSPGLQCRQGRAWRTHRRQRSPRRVPGRPGLR